MFFLVAGLILEIIRFILKSITNKLSKPVAVGEDVAMYHKNVIEESITITSSKNASNGELQNVVLKAVSEGKAASPWHAR